MLMQGPEREPRRGVGHASVSGLKGWMVMSLFFSLFFSMIGSDSTPDYAQRKEKKKQSIKKKLTRKRGLRCPLPRLYRWNKRWFYSFATDVCVGPSNYRGEEKGVETERNGTNSVAEAVVGAAPFHRIPNENSRALRPRAVSQRADLGWGADIVASWLTSNNLTPLQFRKSG